MNEVKRTFSYDLEEDLQIDPEVEKRIAAALAPENDRQLFLPPPLSRPEQPIVRERWSVITLRWA